MRRLVGSAPPHRLPTLQGLQVPIQAQHGKNRAQANVVQDTRRRPAKVNPSRVMPATYCSTPSMSTFVRKETASKKNNGETNGKEAKGNQHQDKHSLSHLHAQKQYQGTSACPVGLSTAKRTHAETLSRHPSWVPHPCNINPNTVTSLVCGC